jgi:hypothetical protein
MRHPTQGPGRLVARHPRSEDESVPFGQRSFLLHLLLQRSSQPVRRRRVREDEHAAERAAVDELSLLSLSESRPRRPVSPRRSAVLPARNRSSRWLNGKDGLSPTRARKGGIPPNAMRSMMSPGGEGFVSTSRLVRSWASSAARAPLPHVQTYPGSSRQRGLCSHSARSTSGDVAGLAAHPWPCCSSASSETPAA